MKSVCNPSALRGNFDFIPPSKSVAHRALMLGALCGATIYNVDHSKDITATLSCLEALGLKNECTDSTVRFSGQLKENQEIELNCNESGSTLRFFIPFSQALGNVTRFTGEGRLPNRPLTVYFDLFRENGIRFSHGENDLPLTVTDRLEGGDFSIRGDVSSQFITGLLLSAPLMKKPAQIKVTEPFESKPYVDITVALLRTFGVPVSENGNEYKVENMLPDRKEYTIEKDWSQAAFFLCGGAISGSITLEGMNLSSSQGDKKILEILQQFGADITIGENSITVKESPLTGTEIDVRNVPDLVPILAVLSAYAKGTTRLSGAARLRLKESDRLHAMYTELSKMGVDISMGDDYLQIHGGNPLFGAEIDSHNDHRIAMAMTICSLKAEGETVIHNAECIEKSYPVFYRDFKSAGGNLNESY